MNTSQVLTIKNSLSISAQSAALSGSIPQGNKKAEPKNKKKADERSSFDVILRKLIE